MPWCRLPIWCRGIPSWRQFSASTSICLRESSSAARAPPRVGTLWSIVATVRSGRRTFLPARRSPSNAWGDVTSWTRWRSTKRRSGSPCAELTTWASQSLFASVFGIGNDNSTVAWVGKIVPWPQPEAGVGSLTCTFTHDSVLSCQPPGTWTPGPYWHPNGGTRELTDRQIDRKSPRPKGGGFFFSDQISSKKRSPPQLDRSRHDPGSAGARRCRVHLWLPRGRQPADLPAPPRASDAEAHPGPPRAGRRAHGRRLRPSLRQAGSRFRDFRAWRAEPGDRALHGPHGLGADHRHH